MNLSQKSELEILAVANPLMDNLMEASTQIDHERHIRDFSDRLRAQLTKARLNDICEFVAEMVLIQDGSRYLVDHVMVF